MPVTIETKALADALGYAIKAVKTRNTIPVLSNVMLTHSAGRLAITATDKDVRIDVSVEASGNLEATTAPARRLYDLVRGYPDGSQTTLEIDGENIVVSCGRSRAKLLTLPVSDFPSADADKYGKATELDLGSMIEQVKFAVSNSEASYNLNGVRLELNSTLDAVGADGHRMAILRTAAPKGFALPKGRTLPNFLLPLIPQGVVKFAFSDSKIRIEAGNVVIVSKLIEGSYPDYAAHTPKGHKTSVTFDRAAMLASARRLDTMANEVRGKPVRFAVETKNITVETKNPAVGIVTDEIEAKANGSVVVGFNTGYLVDILSACQSEKITMALDEASSVIVDGEITIVQMCQRVAG